MFYMRRPSNLLLISLGLALGLVTACGKSEYSKGGPLALTVTRANSAELQGRWVSECDDDGKRPLSGILEMTFEGHKVHAIMRTFTGRACQDLYEEWELKGNFALGDIVNEPEGAQAIDYQVDAITRLAGSDDVAAELNKRKSCGIADWKSKVPRDLMKTPCKSDVWMAQVPFDVILFEGDRIRIGRPGKKDGTSAEQRVVELLDASLRRAAAAAP